jgi:D-alanyl-lipoteichoic acid acyltransferase DltB (MBOAT superfamily)
MLFNSYEFLLIFLPVVAIIFFIFGCWHRWGAFASKIVLIAASLVFYSWWDLWNLGVLIASTVFNFAVGYWLVTQRAGLIRRHALWVGLSLNILLLAFFKYSDFLIGNVNLIAGTTISYLGLALPLGISFFTFQKIAFLVDASKGDANVRRFSDFALFVFFFPQLVSGPIVHHKEMMPQFARTGARIPDFTMIGGGLLLIAVGLTKKVVIADTLAMWADPGYATNQSLGFIPGWVTSLAYAFQLYFDFAGYSDIAVGVAMIFNIQLPFNFESPYKALTIQDFWRRWHITLSRFLRDYVFIPLGGNRRGPARTCVNLMAVFLIGGIWHGASWMFVIWGLLHGLAMVLHRLWQHHGRYTLPHWTAWAVTFLFVNLAWVFFRAPDLSTAFRVLSGMAGLGGLLTGVELLPDLTQGIAMLAGSFVVCLALPNSRQLVEAFRPSFLYAGAVSFLMVLALLFVDRTSTFLYWRF